MRNTRNTKGPSAPLGLAECKILATEDTKKVMSKVSQKKLKSSGTMTGKPADAIELQPEKNINGQGIHN